MSVLIGSARIDENGKIHGGKAGDQTGKEVSTQSWYKHGKGWRVLRPEDTVKAAKIALAMRAACANNHIGYDQYQRNDLYNLVKLYDFDPAKATVNTETDCSALVRVCCAYAGIMVGDYNTSTEAAVLLASGAFVEMTGSKYTDSSDYLRTGDVLVTKTKGHTAVVLTDGPKVEKPANVEEKSTNAKETTEATSGKRVRIKTTSLNVRKGPGTQYGVIKAVVKGKELPVVDAGNWICVEVDGQVGWVSGNSAYTEVLE